MNTDTPNLHTRPDSESGGSLPSMPGYRPDFRDPNDRTPIPVGMLTPAPKYTLAFYFSRDRKQVALILKDHPDWQAGRYNGVGGSVEDGESFPDANVREVEQEIGLSIPRDAWREFMVIDSIHFHMKLYTATAGPNDPQGIRPEPGKNEPVQWIDVDQLEAWKPRLVENVLTYIEVALADIRQVFIRRQHEGLAQVTWPADCPPEIIEKLRDATRFV